MKRIQFIMKLNCWLINHKVYIWFIDKDMEIKMVFIHSLFY